MSDRYRGRIDGFVTLHTYSQVESIVTLTHTLVCFQLWIHPYGHRKDSYPQDVNELVTYFVCRFSIVRAHFQHTVGKKAAGALGRLFGTKYIVGSGADTLCSSNYFIFPPIKQFCLLHTIETTLKIVVRSFNCRQ